MSVMPDMGRAVLFVFKNAAGNMKALKLKGLNPERTYSLRELTGSHFFESNGEALHAEGFIPELQENTLSTVYLIESVH